MRNIFWDFLWDLRNRGRMNVALSKGAAASQARRVDLCRPATWEFSGFSQNGEDGVLDVLRQQLQHSNRNFLEIGSADGIQNNCTWLLMAHGFNGLMVEGNAAFVGRARRLLSEHGIGTQFHALFVTRDNVNTLVRAAAHRDPDVLSLDIDGNDYYIASALFEAGMRPKIMVVEYNSVFGCERSLTIPYQDQFTFQAADPSQLYYGVSLAAWRHFFASRGYQFITVERNGVNASVSRWNSRIVVRQQSVPGHKIRLRR
jgi:hypothetical protein